jgi:lipopolysaccharide heptosyltransferase II
MKAVASASSGSMSRWLQARRILAVRLDNLGDVLMTTPALAAIRHCLPQAHIALLGSPSSPALAPHLPMVDEIIPAAVSWMKAPGEQDAEGGRLGAAEFALVEQLASRDFDAAVVFTVCTQSALPAALLCRMAGIPLRLAHTRENPYGLLSDWVPDKDVVADGMRHEVARQLALVQTVGFVPPDDRLRFVLREVDGETARRQLHLAGLSPGSPYIVVHPGATASSRRYPPESFGIAATRIANETGCTAVFTGADSERDLIDEARAAMSASSISLAGVLGLGELAAVIAGSRLLVANNTGPVHIAAALGTPVVDLYALTNPQHTPWKVASRVLFQDVPCRNCLKSVCPMGHHQCLRGVPPEAVAEAAVELLLEGTTVPMLARAMRPPASAPAPDAGARQEGSSRSIP